MTLPQVADLLGLVGKYRVVRLRRHLLALERKAGKRFLVRTGGTGYGTRYTVTLAVLREHYPDLFYRRDEATEAVREYVAKFDQRMATMGRRIDKLEGVISRVALALDGLMRERESERERTRANACA